MTSPKRNYTATIAVDPSSRPNAIDIKVVKGPEDAEGKTALGIYKLGSECDTLTLCMSGKDNVRPKEFKNVEHEAFLFELKRDKK